MTVNERIEVQGKSSVLRALSSASVISLSTLRKIYVSIPKVDYL